MPASRAFAITGLGAVTPLGDAARTWDALLAGGSATTAAPERLRAAGCEVVAAVDGFDPSCYMDRYAARHMGRFSQFAVAACRLAVADAGLDEGDVVDAGMVVHTGAGGLIEAEAAAVSAATRPARANPYFTPMFGPNMAACQPSIELGVRGPVLGGVGACAAGIQAVIDGLRLLQHGEADVAIAAGTDAALSAVLLGSLANAGALARAGGDPAAACRPFDRDRTGMVAAEGAAAFVLEPLERARARGAPTLAIVAGGGRAGDAHHVTAPHPEGRGTAAAMTRALADAGLAPTAVDAVVAHATATRAGDEAEVRALRTFFGDHLAGVAVTAPKGALGHGLGAAGAFGVLVAVLALRHQLLPPTCNLDHVDPACGGPAHVAGRPRAGRVGAVLVNGAGFGGQNASVLLTGV